MLDDGGNLKLVLCDNLEGGMRREVGLETRWRRTLEVFVGGAAPYGCFMLLCGGNHHSIVD